MPPACQRLRLADRAGLASQDQESSLEGILGVLFIAEDVMADAPDKASVSLQQGSESGLIPAFAEASEELPVGQFPAR